MKTHHFPSAFAAPSRRVEEKRSGMTLIEILVVMGLMVFIGAMLIAFWPGIQDQRLAAQAVCDLQGYFTVAAANARRDQVVWGVRLWAGTNNSTQLTTQVTNCQYLQQPDDFYVQGSYIGALTGTQVTFASPPSGLDFKNGESDATLWAVYGSNDTTPARQGDYLIVNGGGQAYLITQVISATALMLQPTIQATTAAAVSTGATQLNLTGFGNLSVGAYLDLLDPTNPETVQVQAINGNVVTVSAALFPHAANVPVQSTGITALGPGSNFRIVRAPRVVGEEVLNLPSNIVVDVALNTNTNSPPLLPASSLTSPLPLTLDINNNFLYLDILFAPSGALATPMSGSDPFLALWVRNTNAAGVFDMGTKILAVYGSSGLVSAHQPNQTILPGSSQLDPYLFVRDGRTE